MGPRVGRYGGSETGTGWARESPTSRKGREKWGTRRHFRAEFSPTADREVGGNHMPELRQNFFTKEWVIIATERAKRPEELATHRAVQPTPAFVETCPFCPGNESKTPPEVMRYPVNGEPWQVRVIPNKFAALMSDAQPIRSLQHLRRRINGF